MIAGEIGNSRSYILFSSLLNENFNEKAYESPFGYYNEIPRLSNFKNVKKLINNKFLKLKLTVLEAKSPNNIGMLWSGAMVTAGSG